MAVMQAEDAVERGGEDVLKTFQEKEIPPALCNNHLWKSPPSTPIPKDTNYLNENNNDSNNNNRKLKERSIACHQ